MSLTPLERLPAELLQSIFLQSGPNLALVDSSHYIAIKLANNYIYHKVCTHYLTQKLDDDPEPQTPAQYRLFKSKFLTWSFFQTFCLKIQQDYGCLCSPSCPDADTSPIDFAYPHRMAEAGRHIPKLPHIQCRIPSRFLKQPWTNDNLQFMRFLIWTTDMKVNHASPRIEKLTRIGMKNAIATRNLEAIELLTSRDRITRTPPSMPTIRFAVMDAGCDRSIVYNLLFTRRDRSKAASWECEELDKWCEDGVKEGNPKAEWLQVKLKELRDSTFVYNTVRLAGRLSPGTGDYDGGEDDRLITRLDEQYPSLGLGVVRW